MQHLCWQGCTDVHGCVARASDWLTFASRLPVLTRLSACADERLNDRCRDGSSGPRVPSPPRWERGRSVIIVLRPQRGDNAHGGVISNYFHWELREGKTNVIYG